MDVFCLATVILEDLLLILPWIDDKRPVFASGNDFLTGGGVSDFLGDAFLFHVQFCLCCLNLVRRSLADCKLKELDLKTACTRV